MMNAEDKQKFKRLKEEHLSLINVKWKIYLLLVMRVVIISILSEMFLLSSVYYLVLVDAGLPIPSFDDMWQAILALFIMFLVFMAGTIRIRKVGWVGKKILGEDNARILSKSLVTFTVFNTEYTNEVYNYINTRVLDQTTKVVKQINKELGEL